MKRIIIGPLAIEPMDEYVGELRGEIPWQFLHKWLMSDENHTVGMRSEHGTLVVTMWFRSGKHREVECCQLIVEPELQREPKTLLREFQKTAQRLWKLVNDKRRAL